MKQLSLLAKIMFCIVAILLVITLVLGVMTAVKDSKDNKNKNQGIGTTTVTPIPTPSSESEDVTPTPAATPTPEPTPVAGGHKIALDPGQQKSQMTEGEPVGPGASDTTAKMSYGATSTTTGKREYEWSMEFTVRLKAELENRGYEVVLTREENDVQISNAERAQIANDANADAFIRIHANGSNDSSVKGAMTICQTAGNPYNAALYKESKES